MRRLENGHLAILPRFSPCLGYRWLSLSTCFVWPISGDRRPQAFSGVVSGYEVLTIRFSNKNPPYGFGYTGIFMPFPRPLQGLPRPFTLSPIHSHGGPLPARDGLAQPHNGIVQFAQLPGPVFVQVALSHTTTLAL